MAWKLFSRVLKTSINSVREVGGTGEPSGAGLVLGVYASSGDLSGRSMKLTKTAEKFNQATEYKLEEMLRISGRPPKRGEVRIFYGLVEEFTAIAVAGLGEECVGYNEDEQMDESKEAIRIAAAAGCQALQKAHVGKISVESFGHAESAAEGASMGLWVYQELRKKQFIIPKLDLFDDCSYTAWQIGLEKAAAQNLARQLTEMPPNMLTPSLFAQTSVEILCKAGVNVDVKVKRWAKMMKMEAFLAAAKGSCEPPIFLEISYYGCEARTKPVVLIGKGVTFDSGGLCLEDCPSLKNNRGEMGAAASIVATCRAISKLQIPINVKALIPLCESLPGTCALKPGDILTAKNGKTIVVEKSDFDGRLCLADALCYAEELCPKFITNVATLSKDLVEILGSSASTAFSNCDSLFDLMRIAGIHTGDRIWRLPLWHHFTEAITSNERADIGEMYKNMNSPCCAAAFLKEFVHPETHWIHLDTYNVNITDGSYPSYLKKGMSGRPTRTLIEFLAQLGCAQLETESYPCCPVPPSNS